MERSINITFNRDGLESVRNKLLEEINPTRFNTKSIFIGTLLFLIGLKLVFTDDKRITLFLVLTTLLIYIIFSAIKSRLYFNKQRENINNFINFQDELQAFKLNYDEEGIEQISSYINYHLLWKDVKSIFTTDEYIFVRESDDKIILVPASFMGIEDFIELKSFLDGIDKRLSNDLL